MQSQGPFDQPFFMGCSVVSISSSLGWDQEESTLSLILVEDGALNQQFTEPEVGSCHFFSIGGFTFGGILTTWQRVKSTTDTIEVHLKDPRALLRGMKVAIDGYRGEIPLSFPNMISASYFYERGTMFGFAGINQAGMYWSVTLDHSIESAYGTVSNEIGLRRAILDQVNGIKPISFRGTQYHLDLSELPTPPQWYRVGGAFPSIMDIISEICSDGGCSFFVELQNTSPPTIKVRTVSRRAQPNVARLQAYVNQNYGSTLSTYTYGKELREDPTSIVVFGGPVTYHIPATPISYWGMDSNGNHIATQITSTDQQFTVPASEVADILGTEYYTLTVNELRFALMEETNWQFYISAVRPDIADLLGLAQFDPAEITNMFTMANWKLGDSSFARALQGLITDLNNPITKAHRVFQMIQSYAVSFYGRKFFVPLPELQITTDPDSGKVEYSLGVADAAWSDSAPFLIPSPFAERYQSDDLRYRGIARHDGIETADLTQFDNADINSPDGSTLYQPISVVPNVIAANGQLGVVVELSRPIFRLPVSLKISNVQEIAQILGFPLDRLQRFVSQQTTPIHFDIHPEAVLPTQVSVPVQSNTLCYGPWYKQGAEGPVEIRQETNLTPWNFGGYDPMNRAGQSYVDNFDTVAQVGEYAILNLAGLPDVSLGDSIIAGGPAMSDINISVGQGQVSTTYHFRTFTARFGAFSRTLASRIQDVAQQQLAGLAQFRQQQMDLISRRRQEFLNSYTYKKNALPALINRTPHNVFVGEWSTDDGRFYTSVMSAQEARGRVRSDGSVGAISMDGVFAPYSLDSGNVLMPHAKPFSPPSGDVNYRQLSPLTGVFPGLMTTGSGETFAVDTTPSGYDKTKAMGVGWKMPVMVAGSSYSLDGKTILSGIRESDPTTWVAGPLDLRYMKERGVWVAPSVSHGRASGTISAKSWGNVRSADGKTIHRVYHPYSTSIPDNTIVTFGWDCEFGRLIILGADC